MAIFEYIPRDRTMTRAEYRQTRRFLRWYVWTHRDELEDFVARRLATYTIFGTVA